MTHELREQVTQHIHAAFANTPYPGDENVAAYARYGRSLADALRGQHWSEVTLEALIQHRWEIFLLNADTFRFYVPVFMLAALYHHDEVEILADNLIFSLTPQREEHVNNYLAGEFNDYFSKRVAAFEPAEKTTIRSFLDAFINLYGDQPLVYDIDLPTQTMAFWQRA
jgi:hypothetical protein